MSKRDEKTSYPKIAPIWLYNYWTVAENMHQTISVKEFAEKNSFSKSYVRRMLRTRMLKGIKIKNRWWILDSIEPEE